MPTTNIFAMRPVVVDRSVFRQIEPHGLQQQTMIQKMLFDNYSMWKTNKLNVKVINKASLKEN